MPGETDGKPDGTQPAAESGTESAGAETASSQQTKPDRQERSDERATKTWEEINREKAEIQRQREEIERQRREFELRKAEILPEAKRALASAEDYDRMASEWAAEGKDELAKSAKERAAHLRRVAQETEAQAKAAELQQAQMTVMREVVTAHPDLKDPKSALHQEVESVMKLRPILATYPDGIRDAVEVARLRLESKSVENLRKEVADLKQRLAEREKLLQPGGGAPAAASASGESFDSLPSGDREKRILEELRSAESRGVDPWR